MWAIVAFTMMIVKLKKCKWKILFHDDEIFLKEVYIFMCACLMLCIILFYSMFILILIVSDSTINIWTDKLDIAIDVESWFSRISDINSIQCIELLHIVFICFYCTCSPNYWIEKETFYCSASLFRLARKLYYTNRINVYWIIIINDLLWHCEMVVLLWIIL